MAKECPNCRAPVSLWRAFRTTAWSTFSCQVCGSILGISLARRLLAAGVWMLILLLVMEGLQLHLLGRWVSYPTMFVLLGVIFVAFERIVLIERRALTCKHCGYDLQGLTEPRCPECGCAFDPGELDQILAVNATPPPKPKQRWVAWLLVLLLGLTVAGSLVAFRLSTKSAARRMQPAPPTPQGNAVTPPAATEDGR